MGYYIGIVCPARIVSLGDYMKFLYYFIISFSFISLINGMEYEPQEESIDYWHILPDELISELISFIVSAGNLEGALRNVHIAMQLDEHIKNIIQNDMAANEKLIAAISRNFVPANKIAAAAALATPAALRWVKSQFPEDIQTSIFAVIKRYSESNNQLVLQLLRAFLKAAVDFNWQDSHGYTVLLSATRQGNYAAVQFLINQVNVDVNLHDTSGFSPLILATFSGDMNLVELFLKAGADTALTTLSGATAFKMAQRNNYQNIITLFKKYGVNE